MNLFKSSFLCLDIGTYSIKGVAHCVRDAKIVQSATYSVKSKDTIFALNSVIDELEQQLNTHFNNAFITGNFGKILFQKVTQESVWNNEHKITPKDLFHQISKIETPENMYKLHIIPIAYQTKTRPNIAKLPVNYVDSYLKSIYGVIFYEKDRTKYISDIMRKSHIRSSGFVDPMFLQNKLYRKKTERVLFVDLGAEFTTISIWGDRGPLYFEKIDFGQTNITQMISSELNISLEDADKLKISISNAIPNEMDSYTPADSSEKFSKFVRSDINDIFIPQIKTLVQQIKDLTAEDIEKYKPSKIILSGGGAEIRNIDKLIEYYFNLPVENQTEAASLNALSEYIWNEQLPQINTYIQKSNFLKNKLNKFIQIFHKPHKQKKTKFIPIMPSTLGFDMQNPTTYSLFKSANISMIHVDIMDGFYVNNIAGSIKELSDIRSKTSSHLHVHLMTESPAIWASDAINAGADTIILSANTSGIIEAIKVIKSANKRCGIALNPQDSVNILKPVLKDIDEIMVMGVTPGAMGQEFDNNILHKIDILNKTRKKYGLKYLISVDGGINEHTAEECWKSGADLLVSGSYLSKAPDFPLAVQKLLQH
ncbi:MAG: ribulose-phosphate 3-epimerase [Alphaproteobacteria bacterium]|nr:ribulose-phosphate 3-epimerase [Alphaproteobacteria bacterium]